MRIKLLFVALIMALAVWSQMDAPAEASYEFIRDGVQTLGVNW